MNANFNEALSVAAKYCSLAERCTREVLDKIERFELDGVEKQQLIERLKKNGFIDEGRYARAFVTDKFRFNKWGKVKIQLALKQKEVEQKAIQEALDTLDETTYQKMLLDLFVVKNKLVRSSNGWDRKAKLYRFALSKGFEHTTIQEVLNQFIQATDD